VRLACEAAYTALTKRQGQGMKTLAGIVEAGEPLVQQAIDAMRRYYEAKDLKDPPEVVERLRREAESLMQALQQYQQRALGGVAATLH